MVAKPIELTPADLIEAPAKVAEVVTDSGDDVFKTIENIFTKAEGLFDKVSAAKNLNNMGQGSAVQANGAPSAGGIGLPEIKQALGYVKTLKGDIKLSELLQLMEENGEMITGVLGGGSK